MDMQYIWLIIILVAALIEAFTIQFISMWFVTGAVAALITSYITSNVFTQCFVFILVTFFSLIIFMPLVKKAVSFNKAKTNADKYIGEEGLVTEDIINELGVGEVNVLGKIWKAASYNNKNINKGSKITVKSIEGVKLIVDIREI